METLILGVIGTIAVVVVVAFIGLLILGAGFNRG